MRASVVIPSYNSSSTIARTLTSLLAQPETILNEIIVVDSSDDGKTKEILKGYSGPRIQLIHLDQKTMPALGRNIGAEKASGDILAFVDSDAYVEDDWTFRILEAYKEKCRAGGGAVLLPPDQKNRSIAVAQYFLQFNEFMEQGSRRTVKFVPSCNLFCEKKLFREVGGFPAIRACEDVLFGLRVNQVTPCYFDPSIRVYHIFREEKTAYLNNQKMLGRYILIFRRDEARQAAFQGVWPAVLLPAIVAAKLVRILVRVFKNEGLSALGPLVRAFPLFFAGLWAWAGGFARAVFEKPLEATAAK